MSGRAVPGRVAWLLLALLIMVPISPASASAADAAPPAALRGSGLSGGQHLARFGAVLADLRAGRRARPVHILQIGDSHTAGDLFTGQVRARLQGLYGAGGRGVMPPGVPFVAYAPRQAGVTTSAGWILRQAAPGETSAPAMGLAGMRAAPTPGATLTLAAEPEAAFDGITLCLGVEARTRLALDLAVDGGADQTRTWTLDTGPTCLDWTLNARVQRATLTWRAGEATVFSIGTTRGAAGVVVSNLGVIGTAIGDLARRDEAVVAAELAAYAPDLIILAYGTNDGFDLTDEAVFRRTFEGQLARLRRLAPQADVLVLGPPDSATIRPDIYGTPGAHPRPECAPLSPDEAATFAERVRDRDPGLARWYPPPGLERVRRQEAEAALSQGVAYWDWFGRMGGDCSSHALSNAEPPLMRRDHVHFNSEGAAWIADRFVDDLLAAVGTVEGAE